MASDRISVRIADDLQEKLDHVRKATGKSDTELVREALEEYCLKHTLLPSAHDLAVESGILGCIPTGPSDRSTNKSYLKGMGSE